MGRGPKELSGSLQRFGLERDRMRAALARLLGISATDLDALEHLEADGPLTQRDLGERLALTSGAVTMLVDRLEAVGWVKRRRHPTDRRSVLIELSADVFTAAPEELTNYHKSISDLVQRVPEEHREAVKCFLTDAAGAAARAAATMKASVRAHL